MGSAQKGLAILGLASAMIFAGSASAQEAGWYVGASLGQAQVDVDCSGTTSCDDKDSTWKIFGGYQINRNFSVEVGYSDLGAVTASTPSFVVPPFVIPAANLKVESTAWELVGIGSLPLRSASRSSASSACITARRTVAWISAPWVR